ncbi:hypothetical protein GGS26DRAFT_471678 [Hypomontagnella submonticulosa]|nr:hypothetical protein GGS26DRAFT_471678 [Hypomontagnella submonticulosa]
MLLVSRCPIVSHCVLLSLTVTAIVVLVPWATYLIISLLHTSIRLVTSTCSRDLSTVSLHSTFEPISPSPCPFPVIENPPSNLTAQPSARASAFPVLACQRRTAKQTWRVHVCSKVVLYFPSRDLIQTQKLSSFSILSRQAGIVKLCPTQLPLARCLPGLQDPQSYLTVLQGDRSCVLCCSSPSSHLPGFHQLRRAPYHWIP